MPAPRPPLHENAVPHRTRDVAALRDLGIVGDEHHRLALLQTLPGVDLIGAALLLVEIGADMSVFGHPDRPAVCRGLAPGPEMCGGSRDEALATLVAWERLTAPR